MTTNQFQALMNKHIEERIIMNVKDLSILFKHVNFEDDKDVKNQMLQIIQQYLGKAESHNGNEVLSVATEASPAIENVEEVSVEEKVVEPESAQGQTEEVAVVPSVEPETAVEADQEDVSLKEAEKVSPIKKNITGVEDIEAALVATEEEAQEMEEKQEDQEKSSPENSAVHVEEELNTEESQDHSKHEEPAEEVEEANSDELKTYTENFSILATTDDSQLEQLKEEGGYIFREKRTFMLGLCVGNEWIALAKTQKFEEFPEEVQEHLKAGEFVAVEIKSVSEAVKKSRANHRDIEFYGFELLPTDHPVKVDVRNLLEDGIIPEEKKAELEEEPTPKQEKPAAEPVTVQEPTPEVEMVKLVIELKEMFVSNFTGRREVALKQTFPLTVKENQGILKFEHPERVFEIGTCKTELPAGEYVVKFADYTMSGNVMNADMVIVSKVVEEEVLVKEEAAVEPVQETAPVVEETPVETPVSTRSELVKMSAKDAPADFPNQNVLTVSLLPLAAEKLDRNALNKYDKPVNLLVKNNRIYLTYDIFTIGEAKETLSVHALPDMKMMIRAIQIEATDVDGTTILTYTFDQMVQTDQYMSEKEAVAISEFLPLTEENFLAVQQKRAQNSLPKTPQEAITPKNLQPGQVERMTNPNGPVKNLGQSVEQLVPHKEVSESVKALQDKPYNEEIVSNVLNNAKNALSTMVAEASNKTKVQLGASEKQETVIQGTLKEGVGELTETETVVNFVTNYSKDSWERSMGKRMTLKSELSFTPGQDTSKIVTILGRDGSIVAQGQAPITAAMFLDGDHHTAELLSIESAEELEKGFSVSLRLGNFEKVS